MSFWGDKLRRAASKLDDIDEELSKEEAAVHTEITEGITDLIDKINMAEDSLSDEDEDEDEDDDPEEEEEDEDEDDEDE